MFTPRKDTFAFDLEKPLAPIKSRPTPLWLSGRRETITATAEGRGECLVVGEKVPPLAWIRVRVEPNQAGQGVEVLDEVPSQTIPRQFVQAAIEGIHEGLRHGVIVGLPVTDVKVRLMGGSFRDSTSSTLAFRTAGKYAVKNALKKAGPKLVE